MGEGSKKLQEKKRFTRESTQQPLEKMRTKLTSNNPMPKKYQAQGENAKPIWLTKPCYELLNSQFLTLPRKPASQQPPI